MKISDMVQVIPFSRLLQQVGNTTIPSHFHKKHYLESMAN